MKVFSYMISEATANCRLLAMGLVLVFFTAGCVIIPIRPAHSGYARTNVNEEVTARFEPGKMTKADVILLLGEPDAVSLDECRLAYRSEKVVAFWLLGGGGPEAGAAAATGGAIFRERYFVFEFDPQGRFQSVRQSKQWGVTHEADAPELNNPAFYLASSNQSVVGVSRSAFWLADTDGFRGWNGQMTMGKAGQLLITESNLLFVASTDFADAEPGLELPLATITRVYVAKFLYLRRLVVHTNAGAVHSFWITEPNFAGGISQDKAAMQAACDFIQSKINSSPVEK